MKCTHSGKYRVKYGFQLSKRVELIHHIIQMEGKCAKSGTEVL